MDYLAACVVDLDRRGPAPQVAPRPTSGRRPPATSLAASPSWPPAAAEAPPPSGLPVAGAALAVPGLVTDGRRRSGSRPNLGWRDVDVPAPARATAGSPRCRRRSTTRPTSPRSASCSVGGRRTRAASSTSPARSASAPASCSTASCSAARAGWSGELGHVTVRPGRPALPLRRAAAAWSSTPARRPSCAARPGWRASPVAPRWPSRRPRGRRRRGAARPCDEAGARARGGRRRTWSTCSTWTRSCSAASTRPLARWLRPPVEAEIRAPGAHRRLVAGHRAGLGARRRRRRGRRRRIGGPRHPRGARALAQRRVGSLISVCGVSRPRSGSRITWPAASSGCRARFTSAAR